MKNLQLKKVVPYLAAVVLFLVITFAYFSPLLEGKKLFQSDIANFQGASKEIADFREKTGEEALWTNSMFSGMPAYQISVRYTGNLLTYLDLALRLGLPHPADMIFLYFLGFFVLLLVMRIDPWLAVAGAIAFAFSSYFFIIIEAGHNTKAHAIAYMSFVMAGIILTMRGKYFWGGLMTAVFLSLEIKTNHPQITYYLMIIAVVYGIARLVEAVREKALISFSKALGVLLIAGVFGLLTNIASLWATMDYTKYTIRGKSELSHQKENQTTGLDRDYVTQWSYGKAETMTLLIPNFNGGSSSLRISERSEIVKAMRNNGVGEETVRQYISQPLPFLYWGDQPFTSGPVYVGAIMIFLFVLGLIILKGPIKWWLLFVTVLSVLLAWGHNFMWFTNLFLDYVPGYNKFRAVTMTLVIAEFAIPLLGILAVQKLYDGRADKKEMFKSLLIALAITGGITLILALLPGMFLDFSGANDAYMKQQYQLPDWLMQAIHDERLRMLRMDAFRSLVFILLTAGVLWALLFGKIKKEYAFITLIVLVLADMFPVNKRYLGNESFTTKGKVETPFEPSAADKQILEDKDPNFRVLNLTSNTFNDAGTSYFHKSIGGYHGAKLRRYQELIDFGIKPNINSFASSMNPDSAPVLNMLNTKYFIVPDKDRQPFAYPNRSALGNAWFVHSYRIVDNADAEIAAIANFRPDTMAIVNKEFSGNLTGFNPVRDSSARIILTSYSPNHLIYESVSQQKGLAIFSEIYYPSGWNAYLDGNPVPHFRVNYVLRAMVIPEGKHKVEFRFEPVVYTAGETISRISSLVLILLVVAGLVFHYWQTRKKSA